jgi:hypothetical protein
MKAPVEAGFSRIFDFASSIKCDTAGEVNFAKASTLTRQDFQPSTTHEPRVFPTSPSVSNV